jgi:hypothetical protein
MSSTTTKDRPESNKKIWFELLNKKKLSIHRQYINKVRVKLNYSSNGMKLFCIPLNTRSYVR